MAVMVWVTGTRNVHVHRVQDCRGIAQGQSSGKPTPVTQVPLTDVHHPVACRWCWPVAPKTELWHPTCSKCKHTRPRPCPHNGAVQVLQPRRGQWTGQVGTSTFDPDRIVYQRRWVWPENASRYSLVKSGQAE